MPKPTGFNVVVAAKNLNPSIFNQLWLVKHQIFSESDIEASGSVFTPLAVNAVAAGLTFTVVPERLQLGFSSAGEGEDIQMTLQRIVGRIVKELPHTPYQAVGFNMGWVLPPKEPKGMEALERRFFLAKDSPLGKLFKERGCHFGSYLSKDFKMGRLNLDIKPVMLVEGSPALQTTFNFHLDLRNEHRVQQINDFLGSWNAAYTQAKEMVEELGRGWSQ